MLAVGKAAIMCKQITEFLRNHVIAPMSSQKTLSMQRRRPDLTEDSIASLLIKLALPAGIGFLFATLYNLVDSFWANQLGQQLGTSDPIDAFGAGGGYFFLMLSCAIGINQGATAMMTNALGRGDIAAARNSFVQALGLGLAASLILAIAGIFLMTGILEARFADRPEMVAMALDYLVPIYLFSFSFMFSLTANSALASQGDFATLGIVQVTAFILNCIFDPLFMLGWGPIPAFGIAGLAIATIVINLIGVVVILYRTLRSPLFVNLKFSDLAVDGNRLGDLVKQCVPATLNMFVIAAGYIVIAEILNAFGNGAMGGFSNAARLEQLILLPVIGLQIAVLAIVGQNMGAKKFDRVRRTFTLGVGTALIIMGVGMLLVWLFHDILSELFAAGNDRVHAMSNLYLVYSSFALLAYALVFIAAGILQGMKKPIMPLLINTVRLIIGPWLAFSIAVNFFDEPNIHVGWIGVIIVSWGCGLFSLVYVWLQIRRL